MVKSYWTTWCLLMIFVFCPSVRGLQSILDVCQAHAESHGIIFNYSKTVCITFKTKTTESTLIPLLTLSVQRVKYVSHCKYLGIVLDIELSEDKHIQRQLFYLYYAVNKLRASFSRCSNAVKNTLFRFFYTSMYTSQSWCDFRKAYIHRSRLSYNFVCRALYNLPWRVSVTSRQVQCNIPSFEVLLRKKFIPVSWKKSNNAWLRVLMKSDCFFIVPIFLLILWTIQPYFTLWLSARKLQC